MSRIRIIKKNDEYSSEYEIGDIFEIQGTWYGGVHITGNPACRCLWTKRNIRSWIQSPTGGRRGRTEKGYLCGRHCAAF